MKGAGIGFWLHVALMFLTRSGRATTALAVMVVTAVSALIFLSALAVGVNDAMLQNSVGLFAGHITGTGLPDDLGPEDLTVAGVSGVLRRIYVPGILTSQRLDEALSLCGVDPERETALTALGKKIVAGRYPMIGRNELFISRPLAEGLSAGSGDVLQFTSSSLPDPLTLTVSGIYETGIDTLDRGIVFCPLDILPAADAPWSASIFLEQGVSPQSIIDVYRNKWGGMGAFNSWETLMPDLRQLIDLQYFSMDIVIALVFGVVSMGIACIFVIFILKNLREYGIMKAMGVSTREMTFLIVAKVTSMNAVACGTGLIIGVLAVWGVAAGGGIDISGFTSHNRYFAVSGVIIPRLTTFSLFAPPVAALVFGLVAAVWPTVLVARKKAADIIRMI